MADKEERIYILKVSVCKGGQEKDWEDCGCFIDDTGFCKYHPKCKHSLTRQEAIEIMAKAICRQDNLLESCKQCLTQCDKQKQKNMCEHILKKRKDNIEPSYFDKAETALNALLKGVKNDKTRH